MKKIITFCTVILLINCTLKAQYDKKTDLSFRFGSVMSGNQKFTYPAGEIVEVGNSAMFFYTLGFNYNINRYFAVGPEIGVFINSNSDFDYDKVLNTIPYYELLTFAAGLNVKYNYFTRKKIKAYVKAGLNYNIHLESISDYVYLNEGLNAQQTVLYFTDEIPSQLYNGGIGAKISTGLKYNFSQSFGTMIEAGYYNLSYFKGPLIELGFFFDLGKR